MTWTDDAIFDEFREYIFYIPRRDREYLDEAIKGFCQDFKLDLDRVTKILQEKEFSDEKYGQYKDESDNHDNYTCYCSCHDENLICLICQADDECDY